MPASSRKTTLILLAALLGLAGLAFLLEEPRFPRGGDEAGSTLVYTGQTDRVDRLEIGSAGSGVILSRGGDGWSVSQGGRSFPADGEAVRRVLELLPDLNGGSLASRNPAHHADYRVDDTGGVALVVSEGGKETARVLVGGQGPDFFSNYLRRPGAPEVLLVRGNLRPLVERPLRQWRELALTAVGPEEVNGVELATPGLTLKLKREADAWTLDRPGAAPPDQEAVRDLLARAGSLRAVDVADPAPGAGFENPALSLKLTLRDGRVREVTAVNKAGDVGHYLARVNGQETIFLLGAQVVDDLARAAAALASEKAAPR